MNEYSFILDIRSEIQQQKQNKTHHFVLRANFSFISSFFFYSMKYDTFIHLSNRQKHLLFFLRRHIYQEIQDLYMHVLHDDDCYI